MRPLVFRITTALAVSAAAVLSANFVAPPASAGGPVPLRVCTTGDYEPLTYRDPATGQYSGIDVDMATDLAAHLGREPVFVATTWATLAQDVNTPGRCDIAMGGITVTAARQQIAEFTVPYLDSGKVPLVAHAGADAFGSIEQINRAGVRVIKNGGGTNEQFARRHFPNADITIWPDNTTIFDQLVAGNADVMITDALEAVYQSARHPGLAAVHPDRPFTEEQKAYMLPMGSPLTVDVDAWLTRALNDGTFSRIRSLWMS